jgi:hypothetical protein
MGGRRGRGWHGLLAILVILSGCNRQDTDRLARVGRKGLARAETCLGTLAASLPGGWPGRLDGLTDAAGLDLRVSARLRWEKTLAEAPIEVQAVGAVVELRGKVQDLAQRRRAVEIAETTAGVEKVNDLLETESR